MSETQAPTSKRELEYYLKAFRKLEPRIGEQIIDAEQARARAGEIMENVSRVMAPYLRGERSTDRQAYYGPAVERVERAFLAGDFTIGPEGFAGALEILIGRIEFE